MVKVFALSNQRSLCDAGGFYLYPKVGLAPSFAELPTAVVSMYNYHALSEIYHCLTTYYDYQTAVSSCPNTPNTSTTGFNH